MIRVAATAGFALGVNLMAPSLALAGDGAVPGVEATAIVRIVVALVIVLGAIVATAWLLRRYSGGQNTLSGEMRVLGTLSVGQRERVVLVQVGDQQLLLGVAPGRVQTLHVLERPIEGASGGAQRAARDVQSSPFAERLRRLMQQPDKQ